MSNDLITIATFNFATDPNFLVFKAALRQRSIPYFAADENTVNVDPFLSIMVGGIRVQVHEEDVPAAVAIWREILEANENPSWNSEEDFSDSDQILDEVRSYHTFSYEPQNEDHTNYTYRLILLGLFLFIILVLIWGIVNAENP